MRTFACPSCSAQGVFHSAISVYAVCAYCQSMVMRQDLDVTAFGKMAALPPDMSPLQIGTAGIVDGARFSLLGRVKTAWQDGVWSEWFMLTDDGRKGWLVEAQGFLACCFELPMEADGQLLINRNFANWKPKPGERVGAGGVTYTVVDIKQATCVGSEGELPFVANRGRKSLVADLADAEQGFASLEICQGEARFYLGRYVPFDALALTNLRPLEGW